MAKIFPKYATLTHAAQSLYWFAVGFILMATLLASSLLFYFQHAYKNRVIPGIFIDNIYVGEKNKAEMEEIFNAKNKEIGKNTLVFESVGEIATVSAQNIGAGYDVNLITTQALSLGKTKNLPSDVYMILSSYIDGVFLDSTYAYNETELDKQLEKMQKSLFREPVDAQFNISNNRVLAFRESSDGQDLDLDKLNEQMKKIMPRLANKKPGIYTVNVPVKITKPKITTEEANSFGIVEEIGSGKSTFIGSIPNRAYNINFATSGINGILVAPNEEFSFNKTIGDISKFTGYKEAYVISGGKTVLGDGGGVCQVSTTLFRAALNAGLPITERRSHAYRVGYYEQDEPPGFDATIFVPSVDFKFKNDTGNHILIQSYYDGANYSLEFVIYGKKDGREVKISTPVISNVSQAPEPSYQDDPNLPVGTLKQVDFAAPGGKSVFTRIVTRNGSVIISDTFVSVYRPWQAIFLRGTKT